MSSYYFQNNDQGPPSSSPGSKGCGYPTWACEHRWDTIGHMVEFSNTVVGTGVTNWQSGRDWLAFARGNKGFFAMGKVDSTFDTGLPDGDYCDIVSQCKQTITISGGRGHFKPLDGTEAPAVAVCIGCGKESVTTTRAPRTTTTTSRTSKATKPTTKTTSRPEPPVPGTCCEKLILSSRGGVAEYYPELLGKYHQTTTQNSRPVFHHSTFLTSMHLHYTTEIHFKWKGWMITAHDNDTFGYISNPGDAECPVGQTGWDFQLPDGWKVDETFSVSCDGDGPTPKPTTSGPHPTSKHPSSTTTTRKPGPDGVRPTMVVIKQQTMPGSDVFIRGGATTEDSIDITHYDWPGGKNGWDSVNDWNVNDTLLDWGPEPEPGQGLHPYDPNNPDLLAPAMGSPAAWTTDDPLKPAYYSINTWGPHHWVFLVDMDCSQTQDGWFQFTALYSIGGEAGESTISQGECTGEVGGKAPVTSKYHVARCGYLNLYAYNKDTCKIDEMPEIPPDNDPCMPDCGRII